MRRNSFSIHHTSKYEREFRRIAKKDTDLAGKVLKVSALLCLDPFSGKLRTHLVNTSYGVRTYSSRVNGDVRILWRFEDGNIVLLLTVGGHSGGRKVYV